MTTEESAIQVDWRSNAQEPNAIADTPTSGAVSPDSPTASDAQPERSVMQLSAVLLIILGGLGTAFVFGAIAVFLAGPR